MLTQSVANHIVDSIHRLMFSRSLLCDSIHHDFFRLVNVDASPSRHVIQIREHEVRLSDTHTSEFFVFVIDLTIFSRDNDDNQYLNVFSVFCFTKNIQTSFGGGSVSFDQVTHMGNSFQSSGEAVLQRLSILTWRLLFSLAAAVKAVSTTPAKVFKPSHLLQLELSWKLVRLKQSNSKQRSNESKSNLERVRD